MGMMPASPKLEKAPLPAKRKSGIDFGSLAPLSQGSQQRKPVIKEPSQASQRTALMSDSDDEDDEDEDSRPTIKEEEDDDHKDVSRTFMTAEELVEESKLSDELRKTKVSCPMYTRWLTMLTHHDS
jgi:TATA-binding protein-associated factor Taf7